MEILLRAHLSLDKLIGLYIIVVLHGMLDLGIGEGWQKSSKQIFIKAHQVTYFVQTCSLISICNVMDKICNYCASY